MNIVEKMKEDWNRRAARNARFWVDTEHFANEEVFDRAGSDDVRKFMRILSPHMDPAWRVLEIGCGIGRMMKPMAAYFQEVCGVDVSSEMIAQGRNRLQDTPNVAFFENNGIDLMLFAPAQFDLVYSCITFQHMPGEVFNTYLSEIHRVLKPLGFLEFQVYVGSYRDVPFEDTLTVRIYEEGELLEKVKHHGFMLVDHSAEDTKQGGPASWIVLARKTDKDEWSGDLHLSERKCENTLSVLEDQLSLQLAKRYLEEGNIQECEKLLRQLIEHNKADLEAWFELAILLVNADRGKDAVETLKRMLDANPTFYSGYYSLAELSLKMGLREETTRLVQQLRHHQAEIAETLNAIEKLISSPAQR